MAGLEASQLKPLRAEPALIVFIISPPGDPVSHQTSSSYEYLLKWDTHGEDVGVCFRAEGFSKRPSGEAVREGGGGGT